ncbi:MAG: zinc-ribbon domain-containing protein [Anaerolineae bacterium]
MIILAAVMTILAAGFVVYPLFQRSEGEPVSVGEGELEGLLWEKQATYLALKDLEFDRAMGKLSEADYQELSQRYKGQAISILKRLDEREAEIEAEVAKIRSRACSRCGATLRPEANFCPACGSSLLVCDRCGTPYEEGDRFCARCGQELSKG